MLLKNDIANLALGRLGVSHTVIDIDTDNSTQAKVISKHFQTSLETLLEFHGWSFATKSAALALIEEDPNNSWAYSYALPDDALVIREIGVDGVFFKTDAYEDEKLKWEEVYSLTGPIIHTDLGDAFAKYTVNIPSNASFPTFFGRALSAQLATDIAPSIITNNYSKVRQLFLAEARSAIQDAVAYDMQRQPQKEASESTYVRARV